MSLEPGPQLLADLILGFIASVFSPWNGVRVVACLVIPFVVSFIAFGPGNFSGDLADGGGLFYTMYAYFVFYGLVASGAGGGLGYLLRRTLKLKT